MGKPELQIMIDGQCPLCRHEARLLERLDRGRGHLRMIDISSPDFDPGRWDLTHEDVMGRIHAVDKDGTLVTGMEVFRRAYAAVGWGWLWAPTGWPLLRPVFDTLYRWFARNRYRLTGRTNPCKDGRCRVRSAR